MRLLKIAGWALLAYIVISMLANTVFYRPGPNVSPETSRCPAGMTLVTRDWPSAAWVCVYDN